MVLSSSFMVVKPRYNTSVSITWVTQECTVCQNVNSLTKGTAEMQTIISLEFRGQLTKPDACLPCVSEWHVMQDALKYSNVCMCMQKFAEDQMRFCQGF